MSEKGRKIASHPSILPSCLGEQSLLSELGCLSEQYAFGKPTLIFVLPAFYMALALLMMWKFVSLNLKTKQRRTTKLMSSFIFFSVLNSEFMKVLEQ